jgi:hypothetical protein
MYRDISQISRSRPALLLGVVAVPFLHGFATDQENFFTCCLSATMGAFEFTDASWLSPRPFSI